MTFNPNSIQSKLAVTDKVRAVLASPCASYWLKSALRNALDRDCVDAANDAELLAELLTDRMSTILANPSNPMEK